VNQFQKNLETKASRRNVAVFADSVLNRTFVDWGMSAFVRILSGPKRDLDKGDNVLSAAPPMSATIALLQLEEFEIR